MFSDVFLAMTDNEMQQHRPKKAAYMACHFSPYGQGLSNLPAQLPENCLLLLDDSTPIAGHDPNLVIKQLNALVDAYSPKAVLLDFQRQDCDCNMVAAIIKNTRCPVAVSEKHCGNLDCPVFLSPPPVNKQLSNYLTPFLKRGIFLEIAPEAAEITVTAGGSKTVSISPSLRWLPLEHKGLHCHYDVQVVPGKAIFTLQHTAEDLAELVKHAYNLGALGVVGLHQELCRLCTN